MENSLFLNLFVLIYILFCVLWYQDFNNNFIHKLVNRIGLSHEWPMFVDPQLVNPSISCILSFKDGTSKTYQFSNFDSKSMIHRKYVDSLYSYDYLRSAMSDHLINFSGIKNIDSVSVQIIKNKIEPFDDDWNNFYEER